MKITRRNREGTNKEKRKKKSCSIVKKNLVRGRLFMTSAKKSKIRSPHPLPLYLQLFNSGLSPRLLDVLNHNLKIVRIMPET